MKLRDLVAASLLAAALPASAMDAVYGVNLASFHSKSGYETVTPGLYARTATPFFGEVGVYRNSFGFASAHVGVGYIYRAGDWDAAITAGVVTGYRQWYQWTYDDGRPAFRTYDAPKPKAFVLPSVGYHFTDQLAVRMFVIPPVEKVRAWVASFALEWTPAARRETTFSR